jgi:hypothetical protein
MTTKAQLRAQLLNDTLAYVLAGNQIKEIPAKKVKPVRTVRGSETRNKPIGGDSPRMTLMQYD